jgi:hypothetical protein
MAAAVYWLEDIFDMPDSKTNERLHEARRLLRVALEQQAESFASRHRAGLSKSSQPTTTANGDRSDVRAPPVVGSSGDSSGSSSDCLQTRGAKPQQEPRREPSRCPPHWIGDDHDVRDTIKARRHAHT